MSESERSPQLGQIVRVIRGREADQYFVIIKFLDERFVLIANGENRKYDRAKKKNINHLELTDWVSPEVQRSLKETNHVTNGKLRFALSKFLNEQVIDLKKGEQIDG